MKYQIKIILLLSIMCLANLAYSQKNTIQVVTKTIRKNFDFEKDNWLKIKAEKSTVEITGWDKDFIQLTLDLVAKHDKKEVAENDLKYLQYEIKETKMGYEIANFFQSPNALAKIKSNLQARYKLHVPRNINIDISNLYGEIKLEAIGGEVKIHLNFGQTTLKNMSGPIEIKTSYGDILGNHLYQGMQCVAEKSNILLTDINGSYKINSTYGKVELEAGTKFKALTLEGVQTSVNVTLPAFEYFNYMLNTSYANILIPDIYEGSIKSTLSGKKEFVKRFNNALGEIKITSTFSDITIKANNNVSKK
jgi:hypothetical protein